MNSTLPQKPYFDLELFLQAAEETRLAGEEMDECLALWDSWSNHVSSIHVEANGKQYLAIWLTSIIEEAVDEAWEKSPSKGFRLNALAQTLCMCAVHERVPEIEEAGCAPVPLPLPELAEKLTKAGLQTKAKTGLEFARRYAVVTRAPFGGGCEVCALLSSCPRSGQAKDSMFELG